MAAEREGDRRRPGDLVRSLLPRRAPDRDAVPHTPITTPVAAPLRDLESVVGDCALYEDGRRRPGRLPLTEARQAASTTSGFVWIGLQQPTPGEVEAVASEFALPPLAVEDAVKAHQRPKLETYGHVLFAILKPVRYVDHDEVVEIAEIAMFIGPTFVVTVRHGESDVLGRVRAELDAGSAVVMEFTPIGLLHRTLDLVVDGYEETLRYLDEDVDQIESRIFSTSTEDNSERIYKLKREIAEFRRAVLPLGMAVQRLAEGEVPGIPDEALPYFRDVHDHVLRTADGIEGHDRLLSDILQADLARVAVRQSEIAMRQNEIAVRQNEDMRKISAWAAIALVPTAVAGIYGMNFDNMPELHWEFGYFIVVGIIVTACVGLYRLFRRNGWL